MFEMAGNALFTITVALFALGLLLFAISLRLFRRSRKDTYWRRRRDAGQRGLRVFSLAILLLIVSAGTCLFTILAALIDDKNSPDTTPTSLVESITTTETPTPADTASDNPTPLSTATSAPEELSATLTPEPQITETPAQTNTPVVVIVTATPQLMPTHTPFPTFTPVVTHLAQSPVAPDPDASILITALDDRISDTLRPVNPRTAFIAGTRRIYFFVLFDDMAAGVQWRRELYRDDELVDQSRYQWGKENAGTTYFFFGNNEGFAPGDYEIRLYIGESDEPISASEFTVLPTPD